MGVSLRQTVETESQIIGKRVTVAVLCFKAVMAENPFCIDMSFQAAMRQFTALPDSTVAYIHFKT